MSERAPTVSVVIPCFNLGAFLDEAVQSVLDQSFQDFEILIVDDGSTDAATRHLLTSYRRPRTRVLRTQNRGRCLARNLGIEQARARYVTCLDADDVLEPRFLEVTVSALEAESSLGFASCWNRAFDGADYLWSPASCDFPRLLAECTVFSAIVTRREHLLALGGFDPGMTRMGYEDWELGIKLVDSGRRGRIIPEPLYRYRIRPDSMSHADVAPDNHGRVVRYLVDRYAAAYRRHLGGVLEIIEARIEELIPQRTDSTASPSEVRTRAFLQDELRTLLDSRSWALARPLRYAKARLAELAHRLRPAARADVDLTIVITAGDDGQALTETLASIRRQAIDDLEIIVVDGGATGLLVRRVLEQCRAAGCRIVHDGGTAAALRQARGRLILALDAGQELSGSLPTAIATLAADAALEFAVPRLRDADGDGFDWLVAPLDLTQALICSRWPFPLVRRRALAAIAVDDSGPTIGATGQDVAIRLLSAGHRGQLVPELTIVESATRAPPADSPALRSRVTFRDHRGLFEASYREVIVAHEDLRRRFQDHIQGKTEVAKPNRSSATPAPVDLGDVRRLEPVSRVWGLDRGQPLDRYYIEQFLETHRADIRGRVLEVKDAHYTERYGEAVERSDVVDIAADNSRATIVADLTSAGALPAASFDCVILIQTLHVIYDLRAALRNAVGALKPGGVLLASLPCLSRIDYESGIDGDFWRMTPAAASRLFEDVCAPAAVEVHGYGNVLAGCGFLMGLAVGDLTNVELDHRDPYHPLVLCVRVVKDRASALALPTAPARAVVLAYHRVAAPAHDRWGLSVSPANFEAQVHWLAANLHPVGLLEMTDAIADGRLLDRSCAITFDDGYRDSVTAALPTLQASGVPATYFLTGEGLEQGEPFWWDLLDSALTNAELDDDQAAALHHRCMAASRAERRSLIGELPVPSAPVAERMAVADVHALAEDTSIVIGGHGWTHRMLAAMEPEEQRREVRDSLALVARLSGQPVLAFAYPFGGERTFTPATVEILRAEGIRVACTTEETAVTAATDPMYLPRLVVGDWDPSELEKRLEEILRV